MPRKRSSLRSQLSNPSPADYLIASRQCELMHLQHFLETGRLIQTISNLVHGLQQERGASNVFLGSGGARFAPEREAMVETSNHLRAEFAQALSEVHQSLTAQPVSSQLMNAIACALHDLQSLPTLRGRISRRVVTAAEATEAYSRMIRYLIAVVFEAADMAVDPSLAGLLVAMVHLMNGKEFSGQERAVGCAGFSSGGFDSALSERMMHLVEAQERCFEVFTQFADPQSRALWHEIRAHERETEIEQLRRLGCSVGRFKTLDQALADRWFVLMTERMDQLKTLEDALESRFHARCVERFAEARNSLAHQETLIAELDQRDGPSPAVVVVCDTATGPADTVSGEGVGPQFGRALFDLVQEQTQRLQQMTDELQRAKEALEDRRTQEKAVLLLMRHRNIDNDEAHRVLRRLAMDQGKKLPDVARALVAMADVLK
ncbi:nitrate- and nitrite sensing domain-containing protein [uncultured Marinobacter sp.]|jgi:hypothetical protein|uniref:nitrate- and nitrite sensing domain-containing protein n=1 Tax=uncultured Marinobacter sp. TaxID=187379 RepID=UPI000C39543E|nr:response regulator receiver protein [Oceanospirillales bacterium]|tara:strand:- start:4839 stop:6137 length:1299 start_codon:yes stop_codon:yes gene_type:complete